MDLGIAEKVGIYLGLVLIILFGSIGSCRTFLSAAGVGLGEHYVFMTKWGTLGTDNGQFRDAGGIGVDALGHIYVVDSGNDRIEKFDSNGTFITAWGSPGTSNGLLSEVNYVRVESSRIS